MFTCIQPQTVAPSLGLGVRARLRHSRFRLSASAPLSLRSLAPSLPLSISLSPSLSLLLTRVAGASVTHARPPYSSSEWNNQPRIKRPLVPYARRGPPRTTYISFGAVRTLSPGERGCNYLQCRRPNNYCNYISVGTLCRPARSKGGRETRNVHFACKFAPVLWRGHCRERMKTHPRVNGLRTGEREREKGL